MKTKSPFDYLISAKPKDLGGFTVRRSLPQIQKRTVGPFIFFDHMGPVDFKIGNGIDVRPHPHIGLSTLTYLFEGEIMHRDTMGVEQAIRPGAVNWMTAGSGVAHSERSPESLRQGPQRLHGLQIWIALPKEKEEIASSFKHHSAQDIPEISHKGNKLRVVVGEFEGVQSPVKCHSPVSYWDLHLPKGQSFMAPLPLGQETAIYLVDGVVNVDGAILQAGDLGVFSKNNFVHIEAVKEARFVIFGGEPLPEERFIWWNFVSSSKERIEKAKLDWKNNRFGHIKGETEFIPLPEN